MYVKCMLRDNSDKKYNQSGRSMIEMLGVLAIVGVLSAGGIAGYSMAMQSYKTNLLIERIQLLSSKVRTTYKNGDYTGLSNDKMINSGKVTAKDLENPFGENLDLHRSGWGSQYFVFDTVSENIPAEACVDIATTYWGDKGVFCDVEVIADPNTFFAYDYCKSGTHGYPITQTNMGNLITACSGGNKHMKLNFK